MLKTIKTASLAAATLLLASCGVGVTMSPHISHISQEKLSSGRTTNVGWREPKPAWQCQQIGQPQSYNWAGERFKGQLKFGGGYEAIKDEALSSANANHINPDYIYIHIPTQVSVGGLDATMLSKATVTYYRCQNTPAN